MIVFFSLLAGCLEGIGCISPPAFISPGIDSSGKLTGIVGFSNSILKLFIVAAGIYALINLIVAGFGFINSGGDPKNINRAWTKIWHTFVGLLIIVTSFLIAAILGILIFNDWKAILQPTLAP